MALPDKKSAKEKKGTKTQSSRVKEDTRLSNPQPIMQQQILAQPAQQQVPNLPKAPVRKKHSILATIIGVIVVIFGLFLGLGFFLNIIHYTSTTTSYTTTISAANATTGIFSAAAVTNSSGYIVYTSNGNRTLFKFVSQSTGMPLNGLVVGIAINDSVGLGILFTIDPQNRTRPQMIILEGNQSGSSSGVAADPEIEVSDQAASPITTVFLNNLPKIKNAAETISTLLDFAPLAAKAVYAAGVPLGAYAQAHTSLQVTSETYTQDGYVQHLGQLIKDKANENLFMLVNGSVPDTTSVAIDLLGFGFDYASGTACGPTNGANRIMVTTILGVEFVDCASLSMADQTAGLVRAASNGVDQYGIPLAQSSMLLVSKDDLGYAVDVPANQSGDAVVEVPQGDYSVSVISAGEAPVTQDYIVGSSGINIQDTLPVWPQSAGDNGQCRPGYIMSLDENCYPECGAGTYCGSGSVCQNNLCVPYTGGACSPGYVEDGYGACHAECGSGTYCSGLDVCNNGECISNLDACPDGYTLSIYGSYCYPPFTTTIQQSCPDGYYLGSDGYCYPEITTTIGDTCPMDFYLENGFCNPVATTTVEQTCHDGYYLATDGQCWPESTTIQSCPYGEYMASDGVCYPYSTTQTTINGGSTTGEYTTEYTTGYTTEYTTEYTSEYTTYYTEYTTEYTTYYTSSVEPSYSCPDGYYYCGGGECCPYS